MQQQDLTGDIAGCFFPSPRLATPFQGSGHRRTKDSTTITTVMTKKESCAGFPQEITTMKTLTFQWLNMRKSRTFLISSRNTGLCPQSSQSLL